MISGQVEERKLSFQWKNLGLVVSTCHSINSGKPKREDPDPGQPGQKGKTLSPKKPQQKGIKVWFQ
jgi:hypothetical protein